MKTVRIDISKLKYQKQTVGAFVFLSETLRMKGNEFNGCEMLSLPKSQVNVVRQRVNVSNEIVPEIVDIPRWLFDRTVTGNKKLEAKITVI
jgi:hypothetical protein